MQKILTIIPFWKSFDDIGFSYLAPKTLEDDILEGQILEIPFWDKVEYWIVYKIENFKEKKEKLKEIKSIKFKTPLINSYRLELLSFIAKRYFTPIHNTLGLFLPKNLVEKAIKEKLDLEKIGNYKYSFPEKLNLSEKQEKILKEIEKEENNKVLLYWITWSWKTEIYIKIIEKYLKQDKQVLLLIPEIILTNQISDRLKKVFWNNIIILNSSISPAKKTKAFLDINSWKAKIIIGTRSAIFYPFSNLWVIIIDEEHDNSYKSDSAPRYDTIEIAEKITELNGNKLVLASWTPSINSMYKWLKWEYKVLNLLEKYKK